MFTLQVKEVVVGDKHIPVLFEYHGDPVNNTAVALVTVNNSFWVVGLKNFTNITVEDFEGQYHTSLMFTVKILAHYNAFIAHKIIMNRHNVNFFVLSTKQRMQHYSPWRWNLTGHFPRQMNLNL